MNSMLTVEEVRSYLEADQKELEAFLREGRLHAYKIGGTYLRFRKEEVLTLRQEITARKKPKTRERVSATARIGDFWRFNNFYIVSLLIVAAIVFYAIKT